MMNKYRVHEVAKDFKHEFQGHPPGDHGHPQYSQTPKNHMQVLDGAGAGRYFRLSDPAQPGGEHRVHLCGRLP
ncbi:MAG: hypothetical protein ACLUJG_08085 [Lawsonibacter sp.]